MTSDLNHHGLCFLWKQAGRGSQDLLADFKRTLGYTNKLREGIGHTGTLDPFAEGLLLVGLGEGTKLLAALQGLPKTYIADFTLGSSTSTLDHTGEAIFPDTASLPEVVQRLKELSSERIQTFLNQKIGLHQQVPPQHSAVHIDGKRAYEWARAGQEKALKSKSIELSHAQLLNFKLLDEKTLHFQASLTVSSGTYIRALARDWGVELCAYPGHLTRLVRTAIGPWSYIDAFQGPLWMDLAELKKFFNIIELNEASSLALQKNGAWRGPEESEGLDEGDARASLICNPRHQPIAWAQANAKLGRVFLEALKV